MSIFKCKMCGSDLNISEGMTVVECEYCATKQTLPRLDDERKSNLYDRANHFRRNNEFDKAMGIYEQILNEDTTDSEAYWSLVLCRYGIEYVEDPTTKKRVPTVNRAQFTSIFDDEDYKSALQYADASQKEIYEQEAKVINEIQKGILAISQKEEPFDVFICYKESDANGRRTTDSVLATELYHELIRDGFKVFFSRITLEDKLGQEYEPYIFAALNSAKVMVVLGTKPEHFNAVWVKNEWSRYLSLIKNGERKMLIPAYKDMDPYDLPEEFSHLQAQDMSKLGFMQDLIHGIKKIAQGEPKKENIVKQTVITTDTQSGNVTALLKRGFMSLEDGEWAKADEFFEQCLNQNAELAEAYLGKLMAELHVKTQDALKDCAEPFDSRNNYQKVIRFADEKLKNTLTGYVAHIVERVETTKNDGILFDAKEKMRSTDKNDIYLAIRFLELIPGWKDSDELIKVCKQKIKEIEEKEEAERIEREKQEEIERLENEKIEKRNQKIVIIATSVVTALMFFLIFLYSVIIPNNKYKAAVEKMESGQYSVAVSMFKELGDYKDSAKYMEKCRFLEKKAALSICKVGDTIRWGSTKTEDIEWIVLDIKDGKALVISKNAVAYRQYNDEYTDVTWETCTLRNWLNDEFINDAFSEEEKSIIQTTTVTADKNPKYNTNSGNATEDKIFLLSIDEMNKYFDLSSSLSAEHTWLRTPGSVQKSAAITSEIYEGIYEYGYAVQVDYPVRPAMWISIK